MLLASNAIAHALENVTAEDLARANLRVGFSTSRAWYSAIIRRETASKVSHVFTIGTFLGIDLVFEEGWLGYSVRTLEDLARSSDIVDVITPAYSIHVGFMKSLNDLNTAYGFLVMLGQFFMVCGKRIGKKWKNPFRDTRHAICSEREVEIFQASSLPLAGMLDAPSTTPAEVSEFLYAMNARAARDAREAAEGPTRTTEIRAAKPVQFPETD